MRLRAARPGIQQALCCSGIQWSPRRLNLRSVPHWGDRTRCLRRHLLNMGKSFEKHMGTRWFSILGLCHDLDMGGLGKNTSKSVRKKIYPLRTTRLSSKLYWFTLVFDVMCLYSLTVTQNNGMGIPCHISCENSHLGANMNSIATCIKFQRGNGGIQLN